MCFYGYTLDFTRYPFNFSDYVIWVWLLLAPRPIKVKDGVFLI